MTDYPRTPRIGLPLVPDKDRAWGPAMRQAMTDLDNVVPWKGRRHIVAATPSIGFFQTTNINIQLTESCELISTQVDRECWVRVYGSDAARARDAGRQPDSPAPKGRGLYGQTHPYPPDDLTTQWSSAPFFHNLDPAIGPTAYIAVTNMAVGYEGPINLDFEFLPQEQFAPGAPPGPPGPSGRTIIITTAPPTALQGQDGDSAFDKAAKMFYGPKSGGAWPAGISLQGLPGLDGKQLRSGAVDPVAADGVDGEFYYNYTSKNIFGPKATGAWPAGVSLVGPPGTTGLLQRKVVYSAGGTTTGTVAATSPVNTETAGTGITNTQGLSIGTLTITPKTIGSTIVVRALGAGILNAGWAANQVGIFKNGGAANVSVGLEIEQNSGWPLHPRATYEMTTTSLTAITFEARAGSTAAGTFTLLQTAFLEVEEIYCP